MSQKGDWIFPAMEFIRKASVCTEEERDCNVFICDRTSPMDVESLLYLINLLLKLQNQRGQKIMLLGNIFTRSFGRRNLHTRIFQRMLHGRQMCFNG